MYLVLILIILVCVLLTFIVLIQNPKGGGIAANFSAGNQIMGVKRTNDFVEKSTWTLAGLLLVLVLASNFFTTSTADENKSVIQEQIDAGELDDMGFRPAESLPDPSAGGEETPADGGSVPVTPEN